MSSGLDMTGYYARRAAAYERIYDKPERQPDLARLHAALPAYLEGANVLEVACGTGYWTRAVARTARSVTGVDVNEAVLDLARRKDYGQAEVSFRIADCYALGDVGGPFDGGLAAFWWSHVPRDRLAGFVAQFHRALEPGARVLVLDNAYVAGSSTPISRTDGDGNTYQLRRLDDGTEHEVMKNFPGESQLRESLAPFATDVDHVALPFYWYVTYRTQS